MKASKKASEMESGATTGSTDCYDWLDLLPQGMCILDRDLIVHAWNDTLAEWTGISKEKALGLDLGERYPHLRGKKYFSRFRQVIDFGSPAVYSAALHGNFIPAPSHQAGDSSLMIQQTLVRRMNDDPEKALVQIQDVTTQYLQMEELRRERNQLSLSMQEVRKKTDLLKEAQVQAEAANRSKTEFLANMSHEIRTPMTAILGYADVLMENIVKPENIESLLTIKRNGVFLLEIINDILDLSKIEAGKLSVESISCSPLHVVEDTISLMQVRAAEKKLPLEVEYDSSIPEFIESDPIRLKQILINLLGNAIKFTARGSVKLRVKHLQSAGAKPLMQFGVVDTGIGVSQQQMKNLFHPFTQADATTTRNFGGSGLGLTISLRLAEMLGGSIDVETKLNEGSTFTLNIAAEPTGEARFITPRKERQTREQSSPAARIQKLPRIESRILVAEDGKDNQRLIKLVLEKAGAKVSIVNNGSEAVELALQSKNSAELFDIILMDMQMPVLDGYGATRKLRESGYRGPIIALTAHAMSGDHDKCLDAGCDAYVAKPFDCEALIDKIAHFHDAAKIPQEA